MSAGGRPNKPRLIDRTTKAAPPAETGFAVAGRAHAADQDPAFSQRIREGLPLPEAMRNTELSKR